MVPRLRVALQAGLTEPTGCIFPLMPTASEAHVRV